MISVEEIAEKIKAIWASTLKDDTVSLDKDFFAIGGDSLKGVAVVGAINSEFNTNFYINDLFDNSTVQAFAEFTYRKLTNQAAEFYKDDNIIYLSDFTESKKTLFIIHDGSGTINGYSKLAKHLEDEFNCVGIQYVYKEIYPTAVSIEQMAKEYLNKIYKISKSESYYILGWSAGAKIAIEVISQLELDDKEVTGFLFDYSQTENPGENVFTNATEADFVRELSEKHDVEVLTKEEMTDLEVDQIWKKVLYFMEGNPAFVEKIVSEEYEGIEINEEHMALTLKETNVVRMMNKAQAVYAPDRKILSQIYHFIPKDKTYTNIGSSLGLFEDRIEIEGDHFTMIDSNLEFISEKITKSV